jgi:ferric-dicitrate binding protein FerR (iron transport regulator)
MNSTRQLTARFIDDRDSLSSEDFERMLEGLRGEPQLVVELRDQLMTDDLLWQKLGVDRHNFHAQVEQRISDYDQRQEDVFNQVAELRAVAQSELERPRKRPGQPAWVWWSLGVSCLALLALSYSAGWLGGGMERVPVAEVEKVEGSVRRLAGDKDGELLPGQHLFTGDTLITADGSTLAWRYKDGTLVEMGSETTAQLAYDLRTRGKLVSMKTGTVLADVAKQAPDRPMLFNTPHAQARVLGTRLRLRVEAQETHLDVEEGKVQLTRTRDARSLLVSENQSGVASASELAYEKPRWPTERQALAFLFEGADHETLVRNPATGNLRDTPLEPQGEAIITSAHALQTRDGWFKSVEAGDDLLPLLQETNEFTIEAIVAPDDGNTNGPARVVALADQGAANFRLVQNGRWFEFQMLTASGEKSVRLAEAQAGRVVYLTVTYRDGLLATARNGTPAFDNREATGRLIPWKKGPLTLGAAADGSGAWNGTIYALAIHRRVLPLAEQAQNARHGLINFETRHLPLGWRDLLADFDPSRAISGHWQLEPDGWQNDPTGDATARLGNVEGHSYDLRLDLRPALLDKPLELILPLGAIRGTIRLPVESKEISHGGLVLERGSVAGETKEDMLEVRLTPNQRQALRVVVQASGQQVALHVDLNDQVWFTWQGSVGELAPAPSPPGSTGAIDLRVPSGSVQMLSARLHVSH